MIRLLPILLVLGGALTASAAELRIRGLQAFSEEQAIELLGDRLKYTESRPASPSRADDAAFLLDRLLTQQGFTDPEVNWSLPGGNQVLLTVREGPRSFLGEVWIRGADETTAEALIEQFHTAHQRRSGIIVDQRTPYLPANDKSGITNVRRYLQSQGYWKATAGIESTRRDPQTGSVSAIIEVEPGPLHRLARPEIRTAGSVDPALRNKLNAFAGEIATTESINLARKRVTDAYRRHGFQFADIRMEAIHEGGRTRLVFTINAGERYRLGEITVTGREDVNEGVIKERFEDLEGEVYDADEFDERLRMLFGTGAFEAIQLDTEPRPGGILDATLQVKEGKPDGYYAYAGVGSFEGGILGAGYYHRNLFGELWNFSTAFEISGIGLLGEVRVTDPWFLGKDLRFTPRAYLLTRTYEGYGKAQAGIDFELEWDITDHYSLLFSQRNSYVSLSSEGIPSVELGPSPYTLHTLGLTHKYDRRNDPTIPTDGYYLELTTELGFATGDASVGFTRVEGRAAVYQEVLEDKSYLAAHLQGGIIIPSVDQSDLPIDLRYFNGGASSVRSFPERELGPVASNGDPRGGEAYWAANLEYIHEVAGPVKLVAFLDAGALNPDHGDFGSGEVKYAAGLGVRIHLPIGPVRFEYGHALNPADGDPNGAFHFAIGTSF